MRGKSPWQWEKLAAIIAVLAAVLGAFWHYAGITNQVANLNGDVGDLKKKSDDLLKSSADASARLSSLERRPELQVTTVSQGAAEAKKH